MTTVSPALTDLQKRLIRSISDHIRDEGMAPGSAINQLALAEQLGVSRTPIRAALQHLQELGAVSIDGGVHVADPAKLPSSEMSDPVEDLVFAISRDRHSGDLGSEVTENDLMRRYSASRGQVIAALRRMGTLGLVSRKAGFGWRFEPLETKEAQIEGYRLRLLVEPASFLEPGFAPDRAWLEDIRKRHNQVLGRKWRDEFAVPLFDMNAEFHQTLAEASNNRYFAQVVRQQIELRRLRNYSWRVPSSQAAQSSREHLIVLDALLDEDRLAASQGMAEHIRQTMAKFG